MALSDKNILIIPATNTTGQPILRFTAGTASTVNTITFKVLDSGPISIEGNTGQLMSIVDTNTGTIFSVNDISGIPSIEVLDTGVVRLAGYNGYVVQGISSPVPAGTTQADATPITTPIVYLTTSTGTLPGLVLPSAVPGMRITVLQRSGNPTRIWPAVGAIFEGYATPNSSVTATTLLSNLIFVAVTTNTWAFINSGNTVL